jgi:hypothetical protein
MPKSKDVLPLEPLDRISPSQVHWLKECALRGLWSKAATPLLPTSPKIEVGNISHLMLEEVSRGELDPHDEEAFRSAWETEIRQAEDGMRSSWIRRRFVPLSDSIPRLEVFYYQVLMRARDLHERKRKSTGKGTARTEVWLESSDGSVNGRVDRVVDTGNGVILQDYKSGRIYARDDDSDASEVKESYALQMRIYAGLYHDKFSVWPQNLQLIGLDGTVQTVEYSAEESDKILEQARKLLQDINQQARAVQEGVQGPSRLASPGPEKCTFCGFRPACEAYWEERGANGDTGDWPTDLKGEVSDYESSTDGKFLLRVRVSSDSVGRVIHGLEPYMVEDEEMQDLVEGSLIEAYSLYRKSEENYMATSYTTIYYQ